MKDSQAKRIIRRTWAERTKLWNSPEMAGYWIRGRVGGRVKGHPVLLPPGLLKGTTQPDAIWIYAYSERYADVVCFEHCSSRSNLYDKRSRYIPASHSLLLRMPKDWLNERIAVTNGRKARWDAFDVGHSQTIEDWVFPVRFLRVIYALPKSLYSEWRKNRTPTGYEFFCCHESLRQYNGQAMQDFLKRMTSKVHFLTMD